MAQAECVTQQSLPADTLAFSVFHASHSGLYKDASLEEAGCRTDNAEGSVAMKSTFSSTMKTALPRQLTSLPGWRNPLRKEVLAGQEKAAACQKNDGYQSSHQAKESMRELLAKKREIFLVQVGLDVKVEEIAKLKERAVQRDAALSKAEKMLEDDTKRFDAFLKENAAQLQEAVAFADTQTMAKQEKILEIKRLNDALANTRSELMRTEERLEDAKKLQKFLRDLTPQEWTEGLVRERDERHADKMAVWHQACDAISRSILDAETAKTAGEAAYEGARTQQEADRAQTDIKTAVKSLKVAKGLAKPPEPQLEPLNKDAVYFQEPKQLLDVFAKLEAQNLVVIQGMRDATAALEEARSKQEAQKARLDAERSDLYGQVNQLEQAKTKQLQLCSSLRDLEVDGTHHETGEAQDYSPEELKEWVTKAFQQCGFIKNDSADPLTMMAAIEARLSECLLTAASLPTSFVEEWERSREKERRQVAREEKKRTEAKEYQARLTRAIERAAAPTFKRSGKPSMARSILRQRVKQNQGADAARTAEAELQRYIDRPFPC